jgi:hypothetical protein
VSLREPPGGEHEPSPGQGSLRELQEALARVLTDPALRRAGASLPPSLAGVSPERLSVFAGVLEAKRRRRVQDALPVSCRLLGTRLASLFASYAAANPPTEAVRRADAPAFAAHAAGVLRSEAAVAPGISGAAIADLLRYEAIRNQLRRQSPPVPVAPCELADEDLLRERPAIGPAVAVASFDVAVDQWLVALAARVPAAPAPERLSLLVARFAQPPLVRARRVNVATAALLSRCDGATALGEILDDLAGELGATNAAARSRLHQESLDLLRLLWVQGYVDIYPFRASNATSST